MKYIGEELYLSKSATHWKRYYSDLISEYAGRRILDVGAGIGENIRYFDNEAVKKYDCLKPDEANSNKITRRIKSGELTEKCEVFQCFIGDITKQKVRYDTILYIDVLELIDNDNQELSMASKVLDNEGNIIVLSPAYNWLFSEFDKSIGYFRRYDKTMVRNICPPELKLVKLNYLDSVGLLASLANRLFMKQSLPTMDQIKFWDRVMVRISKVIDPIIFYKYGKSILVIFEKKTD